jgi:hypothetical protein
VAGEEAVTIDKRRIESLEAFLLLVLGGFAIAFLVRAEEFGHTAALFPQIVAGLSLVLLAFIVAIRFLKKSAMKAGGAAGSQAAAPPPDAISWPISLGIQVFYVVLIVLLGFPLATFLYLLSAPLQMGYRRWGVLGSYAVLMTVTVSAAFVYLFNVRLPEVLLWHWLLNNN